ncbi:hypothetical protein ACN469_42515 [Corallococcus terminator]
MNPGTGPQEVGTTEQKLMLVTCLIGTNVVTYSPPLKNTPQAMTVTTTQTHTTCLGGPAGLTSATGFSSTFRPQNSCLDLLFIIPTMSSVTWNTGETSTFSHMQVNTRVEGLAVVLVQEGTVVSGKFAGATVVRTFTLAQTDLDACSSDEGLAGITGPATMTLTKLL